MTYLQLLTRWAARAVTPESLLVRIAGKRPSWVIKSIESDDNDGILKGPLFSKKKDALDYATGYISAVLARLREEEYANK